VQGHVPERAVLVSLLRLNEEEPGHDFEAVFHGIDVGAICIARAFGTVEGVLNTRAREQ